MRRATADDLNGLVALEATAFSRPWNHRALASHVDGVHTLTMVATDDQASPPMVSPIVGYACFQTVLDESELLRTAVAPTHRQRGLARAILAASWPRLRQRRIKTCHLEVRHDNAPALALYRSEGFCVRGRRRGYYQHPPGDAMLMARTL